MDFKLSHEQEMVRKMVRDFAENELKPIAPDIDESEEYPLESVKKMAGLNLMGMTIPPEYGGSGSDTISYAIAIEEISRVCACTGVIVAVHNSVGSYPIYLFGTDEQKKKYLPQLASGEKIAGFALTEPGAGSDAAAQQTTAVLDGDEYIINGTKIFISNAHHAGVMVVMAMTDKSQGHKGISAFIVEKGMPGYTYGTKENKMGIRASDTSELVFEDCRVPKENLLGREGEGFKIAMSSLDGGRVGIAAQAVGIAQGALDEAIKYAKEREQFGRPIAKFQAIQWKIADMATKIEAARWLTYRAAYLKDRKVPYTKESAMAKLYAATVAREVAIEAVQIHGGYGYTKDYPVERMFRDAKITEIYEGTSEIQRIVIANQILR